MDAFARDSRWGRTRGRCTVAAVLLACALLLVGLVLAPHVPGLGRAAQAVAEECDLQGTVTAYFLDVGQGDSEFIVLNDGTTLLIDAGEPWAGELVVSYIRDTLGYDRIDWLVSSHPHLDHVGGLTSVLYSDIEVGCVVAPWAAGDSSGFWDFVDAAQNTCGKALTASAGLVLHNAGGCRVEVLWPRAGEEPADLNDCSAVVLLTFGETSMLFTGDASYKVLETLEVGQVDVLKVGHHGSNTSVSIPLLEELSPEIAVIEVGRGNDYGLPSVESLDELAYCDVQTWRTDLDGTVVVTSDGHAVDVQSDRGAVEPASQSEVSPVVSDGSAVVYRTKSGACYHEPWCTSLKRSRIETTVDQAQAMGLKPCEICNPPY